MVSLTNRIQPAQQSSQASVVGKSINNSANGKITEPSDYIANMRISMIGRLMNSHVCRGCQK
uniref:Uncharacterized protein n=1 Tax=viral metagenome TaxID=1070528 RepID=A0A6C0KM76_9ZZZZ